MIRENWLSWPFGIISVTLYGYSCYEYKIYGEMSLQIMYIFISIYGWYNWTKSKNSDVVIQKTNLKSLIRVIGMGIVSAILFYIPLKYFESTLPTVDAVTNGFAIVATFLAARKKIENWLFWIPIDLVISGMMIYKEMYFYAVLYVVYTLFAIYGYIQWKKQLK